MERLTFEGNFCDLAMCRENPCPYNGSCSQRETWERLKAYEDIGLTPEEIIDRLAKMYDAKNNPPQQEVDVLLVLDLIDGPEVCEGFRTKDDHWFPYKYGRNAFGDWNVLGWMPLPEPPKGK